MFDEPAARRAGDAHIARRRLASDSDLGVRAGAVSRILCPSDSASVGLRLKILPPLQGLVAFVDVNPGRHSQTRFALGYDLSGLQPFSISGFEPRHLWIVHVVRLVVEDSQL